MNVPLGTTACRLERLATASACEFVAFRGNPAELGAAAWPVAPGEVRRAADGAPLLLHFAPGRWLAPDPGLGSGGLIDAAVERGLGTRIDVDGKWVAMRLTGADAAQILANTLDIRAVLADRDCAALHLFDCPAIVMSAEGGYRLWVVASCAQAFEAAVGRLVR
jgi:sarcosine oxidase gamma subunit